MAWAGLAGAGAGAGAGAEAGADPVDSMQVAEEGGQGWLQGERAWASAKREVRRLTVCVSAGTATEREREGKREL